MCPHDPETPIPYQLTMKGLASPQVIHSQRYKATSSKSSSISSHGQLGPLTVLLTAAQGAMLADELSAWLIDSSISKDTGDIFGLDLWVYP